MSEYEIAVMESARDNASSDYFKARPYINDDLNSRRIFEAGFERAWMTKNCLERTSNE